MTSRVAKMLELAAELQREPQSFPHALEALDVRKARVLRSPYSVAYIARTDHVRRSRAPRR